MDGIIHRANRVKTSRESFSKNSDDIPYDFHVLNIVVETEDGYDKIRIFSNERIEIEEGK